MNLNKTPQQAYRQPIIDILTEMRGRGKRKEVILALEQRMTLTEDDYELMAGKELRWQNTASWEATQMRQEGILRHNSPYGYWELADYP